MLKVLNNNDVVCIIYWYVNFDRTIDLISIFARLFNTLYDGLAILAEHINLSQQCKSSWTCKKLWFAYLEYKNRTLLKDIKKEAWGNPFKHSHATNESQAPNNLQ